MLKQAKAGIIYFVIIVATLLMRIASAQDIYSVLGVDSDIFFPIIVQILIFGVVSVGGYLLTTKGKFLQRLLDFRKDFGFFNPSWKEWLCTLGITVCMIVVAGAISTVWQQVLVMIGYTHVPSSTDYSDISVLFRELFLVAVLPGVFEELSHRGLVYAGYKQGGWQFVAVSAVLFSLMHQNIRQTGYTLFDGAVIALLMYYTGSILPGMVVHFLNNALSVCMGYIGQNGGVFSFLVDVQNWFYSTRIGMLVGIICTVIAAAALVGLFYLLRKMAVSKGKIEPRPFAKLPLQIPLYKDAFLITTVLLGIGATALSLVWGLMR